MQLIQASICFQSHREIYVVIFMYVNLAWYTTTIHSAMTKIQFTDFLEAQI